VTPEIGRTFTAQEDSPEADAVVVVSHNFWQRRLGGDTAVFGRSLLLDSRVYKVIGVMPPNLQPVTRYGQVDPVEFFVPAAYSKELLANRWDHDINVVGRLNRGVSLQVAQEQLSAVSAALEKQYPNPISACAHGFLRTRRSRAKREGFAPRALRCVGIDPADHLRQRRQPPAGESGGPPPRD
jgi:hypothetical protein